MQSHYSSQMESALSPAKRLPGKFYIAVILILIEWRCPWYLKHISIFSPRVVFSNIKFGWLTEQFRFTEQVHTLHKLWMLTMKHQGSISTKQILQPGTFSQKPNFLADFNYMLNCYRIICGQRENCGHWALALKYLMTFPVPVHPLVLYSHDSLWWQLLHPRCRMASSLFFTDATHGLVALWWSLSSSRHWKCNWSFCWSYKISFSYFLLYIYQFNWINKLLLSPHD